MTPRPTGHALTLPGFVLLGVALVVPHGLARSGAHEADSTVATGWIRGTVHCHSDVGSGAYANVVIPGTRLGAQADENGTFYIRKIPVGTHVVEVQQVGMDRKRVSVEVRPDRVTVVDITLCPFQESMKLMVDSLDALGLWPPKLDKRLKAGMARCSLVTAQRIAQGGVMGTGRWTAIGKPKACDPAWQDTLRAAFQRGDFASPVRGAKHMCGGFQPSIRLSFRNAENPADSVSAFVCYLCGEFSIRSSQGTDQFAFFGGGQQKLIQFAIHYYSDDQALMEMVKGYHR